jgi:uncharacterized protein with PQ loop repeat
MLATFLLEFGLAFYALWRYKLTDVSRLIVATLVTLGTFQLAEYMICGGLGWTAFEWTRLGYLSITLLPPLGIHLVMAIAGKKSTPLLTAVYGSAALFATYFLFVPGAINSHECRPNYAVFDMSHANVIVYGLYYYGWLLAGVFMAWKFANEVPKRSKALYAMILGYVVFMAPTTAANIADPATTAGIPSIMCGFAVLLAIVLAFIVLPQTVKVKKPKKYAWRLRQP